MGEEALTKEIAQELMKIKGEARGMTIKGDWEFILRQKGKEGIKKLEAKMAELGYPLKYEEIRVMDFYPIGLDAISVLSIKEVFGWGEKEIEEMGGAVVKFSIFQKIFMKYFRTLSIVAKEVPKIWREHFSIGELSVSETNEEKRYVILRLENFHVHPMMCPAYRGYLSKVMSFIINHPVKCREVKCTFRGDKYHEFLLQW